eukprot:gene6443-3071_t
MASSMAGMYNSELTPSRRMTRDVSKEVAESARSETFFELLSTDLRLMSSESKKLEGFSHQFGGIFATKDEPNIKESCERALHRLRALTGVGRVQMEAVRESPVEKMKDEAVQLRILQVSLAIIQNPMFSDEEDSIRILLGLAVALVFDHSVLPRTAVLASPTKPSKTHPAMLGREVVAHHLLVDIVYSAGGSPIVWLKTPPPSRTFLLDLLDSILMWRSEVFASIQPLQVCNLLDGLLTSALDPNVDPASLVDVRLVVRCCGALIRRHTALAPEKCAHFLQMLIRAAGPCSNPWQRMIVLQTLRQLCTEHVLVSRLFETYDLSMDHDLNAVTDMVNSLLEIVITLLQNETEHHKDDVMDHVLKSLFGLPFDRNMHNHEDDVMDHVLKSLFGLSFDRNMHNHEDDVMDHVLKSLFGLSFDRNMHNHEDDVMDHVLKSLFGLPFDRNMHNHEDDVMDHVLKSLFGLPFDRNMHNHEDDVMDHVLKSLFGLPFDRNMHNHEDDVMDHVKALSDIVFTLSQHETEHHEDDVMDHLPALYSQKAIGIDPASDLDGMGPVVPGADTIICYLALECLLGIVSGVEALTDMAHQGSSEDISTATALPPLGGGIKADVCTKLVDKLWRFLLLSFSAVMAATSEEPLFSVILKGYQQFCYSAGTLGAIIPRDGFLASLCEFTLTSESGQSHPPLAPPPPSGDGRPPKQPLVRAWLTSEATAGQSFSLAAWNFGGRWMTSGATAGQPPGGSVDGRPLSTHWSGAPNREFN